MCPDNVLRSMLVTKSLLTGGWIPNIYFTEDAYNEHIYEEIPETRLQRLRPLPPIPEGTDLRQGSFKGSQPIWRYEINTLDIIMKLSEIFEETSIYREMFRSRQFFA